MRRTAGGKGIINSLINKTPLELHLPGYNFCGPGTKLKERLARGDRGINPLDEACKEHDTAYSVSKDLPSRLRADRILADKAWKRYKAKDVPFGEKVAAWAVTSAMNAKTKVGGGKKKKKGSPARKFISKKRGAGKKRTGLSLANLIKHARSSLRGSGGVKDPKKLRHAALSTLKAVRAFRKGRAILPLTKERVLRLPKSGGVLPLLPIFAGLSAIGSLAGGAAGVAKAITEAKDARKKLDELQRHNQTMEAIALRRGKGLYLRPYKKGLGLYMTPYVKQTKNS